MGKFLLSPSAWNRPDRWYNRTGREGSVFQMLLLLFLAGALIGCAVGLYLPAAGPGDGAAAWGFLSPETQPLSFPEALWNAGKFFLLLILLSTSWLGVVLTPAAALLRGYFLSCSVAALYAAGSWKGLLCALAVSGVPALFMIPCFLIACRDAFSASRRLMDLRFGRAPGAPRAPGLRRAAVIAALVALNALYSAFLLPAILAKL